MRVSGKEHTKTTRKFSEILCTVNINSLNDSQNYACKQLIAHFQRRKWASNFNSTGWFGKTGSERHTQRTNFAHAILHELSFITFYSTLSLGSSGSATRHCFLDGEFDDLCEGSGSWRHNCNQYLAGPAKRWRGG